MEDSSRSWLSVAAVYVGWRIWLFFVVALAIIFVPIPTQQYLAAREFLEGLPAWLAVWGNFDGVVFMRIANGGYGVSEVPFFPLLPLLMRALHALGIPFIVGGMLISLISFIGAIAVWYQLWKLDRLESSYKHISFIGLLCVLLSFPTAQYFSAVYQDALFLFLGSGALLAARQRRWKWAVLGGVLATLARLNGLALFFVLGAEYMTVITPRLKKNWPWQAPFESLYRALQPRTLLKHAYIFLFLAVPLTFVAYLAYLHFKFDGWQVFFSSVDVWNRSQLTFPLQTFWRYFKILVLHANITFVYWVALGEALFTALYLFVLAVTWGKIRFSYWIFMCVHLLIPMVTGTLQGMPRYGLHLYPLFLVLADWVWKRPVWVRGVYFVVMLALQAVYLAVFARGYFVA